MEGEAVSLLLRPYQTDLYDRARERIRSGVRTLLIQAPTGAGKTVLVAQMLKTAAERGYRAFFNVHRRELVKQSVMTLTESADLPVGIVAAGFPGNRHLPTQVCSVQTLKRRTHLLPPPQLVIWDEAHHCAAASWDDLHAKYPEAVHIGLTATPERLDGTGLDRWFSELIAGPSVRQLIDDGYLSDYRLFAPAGPDLSGVHTVAGDYNKRELAEAMAKAHVVGDALSHYVKYASGRRALAFTWSIESSKALADRFNAAGIRAEHVDGDTDDTTRDAAMQNFKDGKTLVLCNVDLFGEGVDVPAIEAVILLRPTRSLALYMQQVGRSLRPAPGKDYAVILDHAGNCKMHGLPDDDRSWTLAGRVVKKRETDGAPVRQCVMCFAVVPAASSVCRHCGYKFDIQSRDVEQVDGELAEVDVVAQRHARLQEQARAKTLDDLIKIATLRNYKNPSKWAEHVFRSRQAKEAARDAERWARTGSGPF